MSLALEWKHVARPPERVAEPRPREASESCRREAAERRRTRLVFACFTCVAAFICGLLLLSVCLHVMVIQNEVRTRELERRIEQEKRRQDALRVEIATLESPSRIERLAMEELKMEQVTRAEYLETHAFRAARSDGGGSGTSGEGMVSEAPSPGSL